jgi:YidC/Oxa1 family membrane protein insertase
MDKRTILAVVLSVVVLMVYQYFFAKPPVKPTVQQEMAAVSATDSKTAALPAGQTASPVAGAQIASLKPVTGYEKDVVVETPLYRAVFTTRGGALKSFKLKQYQTSIPGTKDIAESFYGLIGKKMPVHNPPEPIELVHVRDGMPLPFTVSFPDSTINIPENTFFEAQASLIDLTREGDAPRSFTFTQTFPGDMRIDKIFTFNRENYAFDLEVKVQNLRNMPIDENAALSWNQYVDPEAPTDSYGHDGPVSYVAEKVDRPDVKKMDPDKTMGPYVSWSAFESKYFISAMIPQNPSLTTMKLVKTQNNMVSINLLGPKNLVPAGQPSVFKYKLFLGPKDYNILQKQGIKLEYSIDFGDWLKWLAIPMLKTLNFIHDYINNFGIAIILLTILIKAIFWPLGNKSYKSMKEMQKLQPKMAELREKYKDDKTRLSQESMALYKNHHVNPMGGCLPMVVQIPVFFGLYKALLYAIELRHAPFFWWIQDLSAKDPYYITPLIMGATMFIQQKMTPTGADPMQAKIMLFMPIIFTFMFLNFPSGLVIYWLLNNVISIAQQMHTNKKLT